MNISSCQRVRFLHPVDLKSGDSGAIETLKKQSMYGRQSKIHPKNGLWQLDYYAQPTVNRYINKMETCFENYRRMVHLNRLQINE